ncbi:hypothetical protein BDA99DRAFT_533165 [Phascolomyces articulosus]|uniref:Uncharacterized protein n=1 Tax=Phascolomyces articulosus TaxID=60185 RepID=A0AAD5K8H2_9FUNG|nr:hypothetical protein BDA99DRAFT_533165 [Phascolomyces articulosus]
MHMISKHYFLSFNQAAEYSSDEYVMYCFVYYTPIFFVFLVFSLYLSITVTSIVYPVKKHNDSQGIRRQQNDSPSDARIEGNVPGTKIRRALKATIIQPTIKPLPTRNSSTRTHPCPIYAALGH